MPAKKENRMRKEFEEKDIHQEVRLNKYLSEAGVVSDTEAHPPRSHRSSVCPSCRLRPLVCETPAEPFSALCCIVFR